MGRPEREGTSDGHARLQHTHDWTCKQTHTHTLQHFQKWPKLGHCHIILWYSSTFAVDKTPWTPTNVWLLPSVRKGTVVLSFLGQRTRRWAQVFIASSSNQLRCQHDRQVDKTRLCHEVQGVTAVASFCRNLFSPAEEKFLFPSSFVVWEPAVIEAGWMKARQRESKLIAEVSSPEVLTNIPFYCSENFWAFKERIRQESGLKLSSFDAFIWSVEDSFFHPGQRWS